MLAQAATMATISLKWTMAWKSKSMTIAEDLLVQHDEEWFFKLRPSDQRIIRLLAPGNPKKNSTLSNSDLLQTLKAKRDEALNHEMQPSVEQSQGILGNQKNQKPAKQHMDLVVQIEVDGTMVKLLCPKCKKNSDLMIHMDQDQLRAIFHYLEPDIQDISQTPQRKPNKKRKVSEDKGD